MHPVLKEEKSARKDRAPLRWGVYCIQLWEEDLSHDQAVDEKYAADHGCECGGTHVVRPMEVEGS